MKLLIHKPLQDQITKLFNSGDSTIVDALNNILDIFEEPVNEYDSSHLDGYVFSMVIQSSPDGVRNAILFDLHKVR